MVKVVRSRRYRRARRIYRKKTIMKKTYGRRSRYLRRNYRSKYRKTFRKVASKKLDFYITTSTPNVEKMALVSEMIRAQSNIGVLQLDTSRYGYFIFTGNDIMVMRGSRLIDIPPQLFYLTRGVAFKIYTSNESRHMPCYIYYKPAYTSSDSAYIKTIESLGRAKAYFKSKRKYDQSKKSSLINEPTELILPEVLIVAPIGSTLHVRVYASTSMVRGESAPVPSQWVSRLISN